MQRKDAFIANVTTICTVSKLMLARFLFEKKHVDSMKKV